ncbi:putative movement protein [maize Iranian mosaic virus]|uniref:Putative movement protein n=1 Tax=maize Iranian mosaic virus TaxID=348823 RepID=A0A2H4R3Y8_9RHAB|nr:putative movement protein [maize Iranian mosaic virus]ATY38956.1 putative movement protein [maize Iranian mosaic virus]
MASQVELPLGKGKEQAKSPMVATKDKLGLMKVKLKRNQSLSIIGRRKGPRSHLSFSTVQVEWKSLCPVTAPGQLNVSIYHNSSEVPVANIWSPVSMSWGYSTTGHLSFLELANCPYTIEGRLQGFSGTEAGILKVTVHLDEEISADDLGPCELLSDTLKFRGFPRYLYTSYTNDVVPDTNIGELKRHIDETAETLGALFRSNPVSLRGTSLDIIVTYQSRLPAILEELSSCMTSRGLTLLFEKYMIPVKTAAIPRSYRACLSNLLRMMPGVDQEYWQSILHA